MPGLIVNGTITRTKVATGADLVGYSGFSASNYLEQPYNSDLDFGTGDFCVMGWVKMLNPAINEVYYEKGVESTSRNITVGYEKSTDRLYTLISGSILYGPAGFASSVWKHFVISRASGTVAIYINGVSVNSGAAAGTVSNATDISRVGRGLRFPTDAAVSASLALLRISATAPTADQIAKIYNDEKFLFQENAQATLPGASDAILSLDYDEVTGHYHVLTSEYLASFSGFKRVASEANSSSWTTVAAHNGLVVKG